MTTPARLLAELRAQGLTVRTDNWWNATPEPGSWVATNTGGLWTPAGVMLHHTGPFASVPSMLSMLEHGRSDLSGPLCQIAPDPSGVVHMIGWGTANHAGKGDADVLAAVRAGSVPPEPDFDSVGGNQWHVGVECLHPGDATSWPTVQYTSMVRIAAACCITFDFGSNAVGFHKGWTTRKPDPVQLQIASFRSAVAARLSAVTPIDASSTTLKDDAMRQVGSNAGGWIMFDGYEWWHVIGNAQLTAQNEAGWLRIIDDAKRERIKAAFPQRVSPTF